MQVSANYSATSLSFTSNTSEVRLSLPAAPAGASTGSDRVELSEAALLSQSGSLSISGTTSGKKGAGDIDFTLGVGFQRASLSAASTRVEVDSTGATVTSESLSAETNSSSFSFAMASEAGGADHLNDEISKVSKEMKPAVKEFLAAAGMNGGWGQMNRLLRSVA
ncbi:hypothetical protein LPW11_15545 [Geomonas sp. RF6]|uniref:hypothetical protein n=1 Tax=Geomonas sp. RF6 TaxID=2897342 RepID=UPI001E287799|nr:hypothetical protein [Geomonas sp. RF6]UFS69301.1 hypothetical protein LPW11_15545 [Geomonas sp. RF6]